MTVIFDGHDLGTLFTCGDPDMSILDFRPDLETVPGRNGSAFLGSTLGDASVAFKITVTGASAAGRRAAFSTLGSWLLVDEPKHLVLPDTPDRYYLAVPSGSLDIERYVDGETAVLSFDLVDPVAYSVTERTVTVPSGGSVTFDVGGTYPASPRVQATAVRSSSSLLWGIKLDGGDYMHVATGSASGRAVVADCASHTLTVSNSAALMTVDSDWLELAPGSHTLSMDNGTGAATVTFRERWL